MGARSDKEPHMPDNPTPTQIYPDRSDAPDQAIIDRVAARVLAGLLTKEQAADEVARLIDEKDGADV